MTTDRETPSEFTLLAEQKGRVGWRLPLAFVGAAALLALSAHRVQVDCDRAAGVCTVSNQGAFRTTQAPVSLDGIRGAEVVQDNGMSFVQFTTAEKPVRLSTEEESSDGPAKAEAARAINDFVQSNAPTLHTGFGSMTSGWPAALVLLLFGIVVSMRRTVRILVEPGNTLRVERSLLGRWPSVRRYPLDGVRSAEAAYEPPRDTWMPRILMSRRVWLVMLRSADSATPIEEWETRFRGPTDELCAALQAHLQG